jgi:hypothetical protein
MRNRQVLAGVTIGLFIGFATASMPASAQVATALIREGDEVPGQGNVNSISNPAVSHAGGYAVTLNTLGDTTTLSHVWGDASGGPGSVIFTEGTYAGYQQNSFESFHGLSDAGDPAYSAVADEVPAGSTGLDGVWVGATPVLVEEQAVPSMPGQYSVFGSRPGITADGHPYWVGGISTVQGGSTQNRVLFYGYGATPMFMGGDPVGGVPEAAQINTGGVDFNYRFSAYGTNWVMEVLVNSGSSLNDGVVVANGTAVTAGGGLMREASPVPVVVGGLPGETWDNFDYFGINESGLILVTGDTGTNVSQDEFVLLGEQIVLREGAVLSTPSGDFTVNGAIEGAYINEQGDWAATWDVDDSGLVNREALIYNGDLLLIEGDPVDLSGDGTVEPDSLLANFTGISTLAVGDRIAGTVSIYFTADIDTEGTPSSSSDDTEALFRLDVPLENQPPVAVCRDVTVEAGSSCEADADVDDGSFDPDGDPITLAQQPPGPYPLGSTTVRLTVTDDSDATDFCRATVTVVPAPLGLEVSADALSWDPPVCDVGYDVVRGDLETLLASGGDFAAATVECLANDHATTSLAYGGSPEDPGAGFWFLARRVGTSGNGTYDSGGPSQQGLRDGEIAASGVDCP